MTDESNRKAHQRQLVTSGHPGAIWSTAGAQIHTMTFSPTRAGKTVLASAYQAMRLTSAELTKVRGADQAPADDSSAQP